MGKRNKIYFTLLSCLFSTFFLLNSAEAAESTTLAVSENEKDIEKDHQKSLKQEKAKEKLEKKFKEKGFLKESLYEEGGLFFDEDDKLILQIKKNTSSRIKNDKLKNISQELNIDKNSEFGVQYVEYSQAELEELVEKWYSKNNDINFSANTIIKYDYLNNRVEIKTNQLEEKKQNILKQRYGNKINLIIDPSFKDNSIYSKSRKADWNKLGAGIGIHDANHNACSTGGIVKKDSRYFLLTAGHCIGSIGDTINQWFTPVGTAHLDARSSDYDIGLVLINKGDLIRYASNGIFLNDAQNPNDYEGRLQNYDNVDNGEVICKSGIRTNYTCGKVTSSAANIGGEFNFEVRNHEAAMAGQWDSGSAGFRSSNGYLIGIQSRISTDFKIDNIWYGYRAYFAPYKPMADKYGLSLYTSNSTTRVLN